KNELGPFAVPSGPTNPSPFKTPSPPVYRSKLCSQQRPCLYDPEWSSFPGLKEEQRDRITVVTALTCSLAGRLSEPPHPTATEVSCS
ncbi:hypothetical protein CRENBAI_010714, partial [Crenichthys baileyi]